MARLIDPKTFRLELDKLDCIDKFGYVILPITKLNIALERSTVDAVPVVRCRECKHWDSETKFPYCWYRDDNVEANDYCSKGERKGGDE